MERYKTDTKKTIMISMKKILIVEDEQNIAEMERLYLSKNGFSCTIAFDGETAADLVEKEHFDLVLLDVMIGEIDGFELIRYIKQYHIPVIFVTARVSVEDRVLGLRLGADDYILKPFDLKELGARVEAVLRRYGADDQVLQIGDLTVNVLAHMVKRDGKQIPLTAKEFDLLLFFYAHKNIALYRETIYEQVWQEPFYGNTRTVDLHVQRLKKKLGLEDYIRSIYKVGYMFCVDDRVK